MQNPESSFVDEIAQKQKLAAQSAERCAALRLLIDDCDSVMALQESDLGLVTNKEIAGLMARADAFGVVPENAYSLRHIRYRAGLLREACTAEFNANCRAPKTEEAVTPLTRLEQDCSVALSLQDNDLLMSHELAGIFDRAHSLGVVPQGFHDLKTIQARAHFHALRGFNGVAP